MLYDPIKCLNTWGEPRENFFCRDSLLPGSNLLILYVSLIELFIRSLLLAFTLSAGIFSTILRNSHSFLQLATIKFILLIGWRGELRRRWVCSVVTTSCQRAVIVNMLKIELSPLSRIWSKRSQTKKYSIQFSHNPMIHTWNFIQI